MQIDPTPDPTVIRAAGGVVWWHSEGAARLALIHRPRHRDWSLPKGKLTEGESWQQAAVREVREETGCKVEVAGFAGTLSYLVNGRPKVVLFWHMRRIGECPFHPTDEVDEVIWLSPREAISRLTHPVESQFLTEMPPR